MSENQQTVIDWSKSDEIKTQIITHIPKIIIHKKELINLYDDLENLKISLEGSLEMPPKYSFEDIRHILDRINVITLPEEIIEIIEYSPEQAREAILNLLKSEKRKFYISEVSEILKMDLRLTHQTLTQLENEGTIK